MNWLRKIFKRDKEDITQVKLPYALQINDAASFNALIESNIKITKAFILDSKLFIVTDNPWLINDSLIKNYEYSPYVTYYFKTYRLFIMKDSDYNALLAKIEDDMEDSIENIFQNELSYRRHQ